MVISEQLTALKNRLRQHWLRLLLVAAVLAAGMQWWAGSRQAEKAVVPVVKADGRVLAEGIVYPVRYAQMSMPLEGMVGEVLAKEGDVVKAGQPIIRLVREDYHGRVVSARSVVAQAAAALEQARVDLADADRELHRQQRLDQAGATSRQQLDQARTAAERNRAALAQAQANLIAKEGTLSESEGEQDKTELRAPITGTIVYLDVKVGEHATPGKVLVRIADESAWEVRSDDLTELTVARIRVGDAVTLTFDGITDLEIPGRVKFIRPFGEEKRGDITYTVFVDPERWDERLRWNMTAQLAVTTLH